MREIKFRAWDKKHHEMLQNAVVFDSRGIETTWYESDVNYIFMQYTGLKDSNGVEIYEGDMVLVTDTEELGFHFIGQVKYGVRGYPVFDIYDEDNTPFSDEYNTLSNYDLILQVIGNIYENPELLNNY